MTAEIAYVCGCTQDENRELASDLKRTEVGHPEHEVWHDEEYGKSVMRGEQPDETGKWLCGCREQDQRQEPQRKRHGEYMSSDPLSPHHSEWHEEEEREA